MKLTIFALSIALCGAAFAQDGLPTQKILTFDVAHTIAMEAMAKCRADGYHVTVTVVDGANTVRAILRDDGAGLATVEVGRMKANSVMFFGRPSGPPPNLAPGAPVPAPVVAGTINAAGGVPIKVGDQMIGAVSVSGAPGGDKDAACANAALAKIADKLK
ncbi:MAG TPA: heme-binding protein [Bryobacteraceae bacterium]|nr:heme-binding protein [Bryobacteraceae bacterium]